MKQIMVGGLEIALRQANVADQEFIYELMRDNFEEFCKIDITAEAMEKITRTNALKLFAT